MQQLLEVSVLPHPVAVAPNVDDVAVVGEAIDLRSTSATPFTTRAAARR